jgi:peptidyl-dipeptidase Dcp
VKKIIPLVVLSMFIFNGCNHSKKVAENPFLTEFSTPFGVPPFDQITLEDYLPAFKEGISQQKNEVDAIVNNQEAPTFENTVVDLEKSGEILTRVGSVFYNMNSSNTSDEIQNIAKELSPLLSKHEDDILLNEKLFERIRDVYNKRDTSNLTAEQGRLLEETYKMFVRGGANLSPAQKETLRTINKELSLLQLRFSENVLAETNSYKLVIDNKDDLEGLPESVIAGAAETAKEDSMDGKWVFTTQKPSMIPFLQYAKNRELREKILTAYIKRGDNNNEHDNKAVVTKILNLRIKRAHLLGYKSHADYVLENRMAKNPENVFALLNKIWNASLPVAKKEVSEMQSIIDNEGGNFKLAAWDWWYYAEKLKKEKYDLDEEATRPYFKLENIQKGLFDVTNKLYGLQFVPRNDIPKYQKDVQTYEVKEADGTHVGILYMDFYPRASKRPGAWMSSFRKQSNLDGKKITPIVTTNFNFTKPVGDQPALLSYDEVQTMFHEFGHALHGLLSKCTYRSLSGTSVDRDFVELPSQIMENWVREPEVLKTFAMHYKTGEPIPQEMIDKFNKSKFFNQGFETVEYLSAAILDMDYHVLTEPLTKDVNTFEKEAINKMGLIPEIIVRYRSTYFSHIFSGGYSSGYYSYIWAQVLDADAFEAFREHGLFDPATAAAFRKNILEKGGTDDPMKLYVAFRGEEPSIDPLLRRKGLEE